MKLIVGIDEAGRGPLAGPVSVGAFVADKKTGNWILKNIFNNKLRDSKKLSPKKRGEIYAKLSALKDEGKASFFVSHISNKIIDKKGIIWSINHAIKTLLVNTKRSASNIDLFEKSCVIKLDGLLKAPLEFKNQKTIIKGDEKDIFIACASIIAKVRRDRLMCRLTKKYPKYKFETHKGYGTLLHRTLIKKHGLSPIHRKSYCKKLDQNLK